MKDHELTLLREVYRRFRDRGEWPSARELDLALADTLDPHGGFMSVVREVGTEYVFAGSPDNRRDQCRLTLAALQLLPEAANDVRSFLAAVRHLGSRYRQSPQDEVQVSAEEFVTDLGMDEATARRVALIIGAEADLSSGSGGGGAGQWAFFTPAHATSRLTEVTTVEEFFERRARYRNEVREHQLARNRVPAAQVAKYGRWEVLRELARAGPGRLLVVRDSTDPRTAAHVLKEMRYPKPPSATAYQRFVREIEITRQLAQEHAGIVSVVEYSVSPETTGGSPYYIMPLAESSLAKARELTGRIETVLDYGQLIADALAFAHGRGVIHRDVKPGNVLLFGEGREPKVADFGICFLQGDDDGRLTRTDADTVGPADFVAPELEGGRADEVDGRVDIYSLGKTLYYMLSGGECLPRERFADERFDLRRTLDDPRVEHLYGLLEHMVVEIPDQRFGSMEQCRDALRRALANVKAGAPYRSGMYGGPDLPAERLRKARRALEREASAEGHDAVVNMIDDAFAAVASAVGSELPPTDGVRDDELICRRLAPEAAEHLIAIGVAVAIKNSPELFEQWLDRISVLVRGGRSSARPAIEAPRAAAATAFFSVSVCCQHRERFELLRQALDRYKPLRARFHQFQFFKGSNAKSWTWIYESVADSPTLKSVAVASRAEESLALIAGIVTLQCLLGLSADERNRVVRGSAQLVLQWMPGVSRESAGWPGLLAEVMQARPGLARRLADSLFARSIEELRVACKGIAPLVQESMMLSGWMDDVRDFGRYCDPEGEWERWLSG